MKAALAARRALAGAIAGVEQQMAQHALLESRPPSDEALASRQPFCVDTLRFPQWVQFVFLPGLRERLEAGDAMPEYCDVAPMAEEYLKMENPGGQPLVDALEELDRLVTAST